MTWSIATGKGIVSENFSIPSSCLVIQMDYFILYRRNSANNQTIQPAVQKFSKTKQRYKIRRCFAPSDKRVLNIRVSNTKYYNIKYSNHCHQHHIWQITFAYIHLPNTVIFLSIGSLTKTAFPFPDIVSPEILSTLQSSKQKRKDIDHWHQETSGQ